MSANANDSHAHRAEIQESDRHFQGADFTIAREQCQALFYWSDQ